MEDENTPGPSPGIASIASSGLPDEGSLLDAIRNEREERAADIEEDFLIPGTSRVKIYARYRKMDGRDLNKIGRRAQKEFRDQFERVLYASIDIFLEACVGIYYELDGGDRKPLTWQGQEIDGYTMALAQALGFADKVAGSAGRSVVFGAFNWNDVAILRHNIELGRWMSGVDADVDEDFFGGNL